MPTILYPLVEVQLLDPESMSYFVVAMAVLMSPIRMTGSDKRADHLLDTKLKIVSFLAERSTI